MRGNISPPQLAFMDKELAKHLFNEGATLVLLDVPERTEFGIDYNSWNVGPKFRGVKCVPPGFHFIYYSAVDKQGQSAPRTGFFHFFVSQEVVIKRWDPKIEDITDEGIDNVTVSRIKDNLKDLDRFLGVYPYESLKKWVSLTNHITESLVIRLQPISGQISSVTQVCPDKKRSRLDSSDAIETDELGEARQGGEMKCGEGYDGGGGGDGRGGGIDGGGGGGGGGCGGDGGGGGGGDSSASSGGDNCGSGGGSGLFPGGVFAGVGEFLPTTVSVPRSSKDRHIRLRDLEMNYNKEAMLRFSTIPCQKYPDGATPAEISHHNMDLSFAMETMLSGEYNNDEMALLGELQFSFICFLVGHVFEAFEHWKKLVELSCMSEDALLSHVNYFTHFITVMHFQLHEIPDDFFVDIISKNNFLTTTLQSFFSNLDGAGDCVDHSLVKKGLRFKENLTKHYKWDFSSEPDDFAPTVVDM